MFLFLLSLLEYRISHKPYTILRLWHQRIIPKDAYFLVRFSMRTRMVEFDNVLNAYMFKLPSKERETSSAICNAFLSHHVPAREIPPPAPPSPTFQIGRKEPQHIINPSILFPPKISTFGLNNFLKKQNLHRFQHHIPHPHLQHNHRRHHLQNLLHNWEFH